MNSKIIIRYVFLPIFALILASCNNNVAYNNCKDINEDGWSIDAPAKFYPVISDTITKYNIIVTLRHTTEYKYQNFWMFINVKSPDGLIAKDTVECYLADNRGNFLGRGVSIFEMPVLISQNIQFDRKGKYKFEVIQGMRDTLLTGIKNVCLTIEKSN
ncbi:MAG: gliding motility lipoprotein GldH [Paludibacteraceae bacterium]|nr:gliding motility lipoprotein GldH [Paludibacteraceae bacterium]